MIDDSSSDFEGANEAIPNIQASKLFVSRTLDVRSNRMTDHGEESRNPQEENKTIPDPDEDRMAENSQKSPWTEKNAFPHKTL